ncbi:C39 family peptidase [Salinibacillus xinjiangensis]|uniref:Peptidase C39-like domain-containing protein n=1 Tax=Salinibacillus xinjiangensis TaxID=1229268 RepID=A0A6G1X2U8_9BACI|nr:C39 family peptidase [Salinibacillus xinjiangensis]MRG85225.1 hypothetical protein [Salinibacillus xinjiangensis]
MTLTLILFCLFMGFGLNLMKNKYKLFQKKILRYSRLFIFCAILMIIVATYQSKQTWLPKFRDLIVAQEKLPEVKSIPTTAKPYSPVEPLLDEVDIKSSVKLKAAQIAQMPQLPRGCEVTSLAMLLRYHNYETNKMRLAKEITRDPSPHRIKDGKTYFGHPNRGFVGNMYDFSEPGYGVYHKPIAALAKKYAGEKVQDLTGQSFYRVLEALNKEQPVLVIINAKYKKLPKSEFETWHTTNGTIEITMNEHSVLVTGYDEDYVYFNDPLERKKKAPFDDFLDAWVQMGKQAVTIEKS